MDFHLLIDDIYGDWHPAAVTEFCSGEGWMNALSCAPQEEVFNYIHNILSIPGHSAEEKQSVWQKAMDHMEVLTPDP